MQIKLTNDWQVMTSCGFKDFKGVKKVKNKGIKIATDGGCIKVTQGHKFFENGSFIDASGLQVGDYISGKQILSIETIDSLEDYYDLLEVSDGHHYTTSNFESSNCAFINPNAWDEFADSIFPSQSALSWKKNIIISTAKGLNHFYEIVQRAKASNIKNKADPSNHDGTELVEVDWREVPRYGPNGLISLDEFKSSIINRYGSAYFEQNYGNNFMGSSETLIDTEILEGLRHSEPLEEWGLDNNKLKVYEMPEKHKVYIMGVDAAKDGEDNFSVQVLDISEFPFKQVASAKCQTNYLEMPEYLYEWAIEFNTPYLIIENNEGAGQSIADTLMNEYEYPNLYFDKNKLFPGFRTTQKSRLQILKLMQVLMNSNKIHLVDLDTINEFKKFEKVNGKYQASDGHDDMVMSLAIALAPLMDSDNFENYKAFLQSLKNKEIISTSSFLTDLGTMSFADI